jgi:hypothetical protein
MHLQSGKSLASGTWISSLEGSIEDVPGPGVRHKSGTLGRIRDIDANVGHGLGEVTLFDVNGGIDTKATTGDCRFGQKESTLCVILDFRLAGAEQRSGRRRQYVGVDEAVVVERPETKDDRRNATKSDAHFHRLVLSGSVAGRGLNGYHAIAGRRRKVSRVLMATRSHGMVEG